MKVVTATAIDTVSSIDPQTAAVVGAVIGVVVLFGLQHRYGHIPSLWRLRRLALPLVAGVGKTDTEIGDAIPEKTRLPLQEEEFAGVLDATPAEVRAQLRDRARWYGAPLASIQYEQVDDDRVYEVGSYAYREQGPLGEWQIHVRLTPRDGGRKTALWAHREKSPWRRPVEHYNAEGWSAEEGVAVVRDHFDVGS